MSNEPPANNNPHAPFAADDHEKARPAPLGFLLRDAERVVEIVKSGQVPSPEKLESMARKARFVQRVLESNTSQKTEGNGPRAHGDLRFEPVGIDPIGIVEESPHYHKNNSSIHPLLSPPETNDPRKSGKEPGPAQVARTGQKKSFRPKPPTTTGQSMKPRSSTPQPRKGHQP